MRQIKTITSSKLSKELKALESKIRTGMKAYLVVGEACEKIINAKLYEERGFSSFEAYMAAIFDISRTYAYRLVWAYQIDCILKSAGFNKRPTVESQARCLAVLRVEDTNELDGVKIQAVWTEILKEKNVTAAVIQAQVNIAIGKIKVVPKVKTGDNKGTGSDNTGKDTGGKSGNPNQLPGNTDKDTEIRRLEQEVFALRLKLKDIETRKAENVERSKLFKDIVKAGLKVVNKAGMTVEQLAELSGIKKAILG